MSSARSLARLGETEVARTAGELMEVLASLAGDNYETPVLLTREDEYPLVTLTRDHGVIRVDIEPDNKETELRWLLHECEVAIENGEPDLEARREYLTEELNKELPETLNKADRARIADALRYAAKPLPYADTEKVALLDLAGRIEKGLTR